MVVFDHYVWKIMILYSWNMTLIFFSVYIFEGNGGIERYRNNVSVLTVMVTITLDIIGFGCQYLISNTLIFAAV